MGVGQSSVLASRDAAVAWCDRINRLEPEHRSGAEWHHVLLGKARFYDCGDKGGSTDLLEFAKLRPVAEPPQQRFAF